LTGLIDKVLLHNMGHSAHGLLLILRFLIVSVPVFNSLILDIFIFKKHVLIVKIK
jgi:hypothetical protein